MSLTPIVPKVAASAYRLDQVGSAGSTLDIDATSAASNPKSVTFKPDGTRLFAGDFGTGASDVYYWDLSTAWAIGTASYGGKISLTGGEVYNVQFNATGTVLYAKTSGSDFDVYTLSSAYGGTATFSYEAENIAEDTPTFFFSDDGGRVFDHNGNKLYVRVLSTPYDLATAGSRSTVKTFGATIESATVGRSGTRLLVTDNTTVTEYNGDAYSFGGMTEFETFTPDDDCNFALYAGNGRSVYAFDGKFINPNTLTQYSTVG